MVNAEQLKVNRELGLPDQDFEPSKFTSVPPATKAIFPKGSISNEREARRLIAEFLEGQKRVMKVVEQYRSINDVILGK
jgi:hypothetical protein